MTQRYLQPLAGLRRSADEVEFKAITNGLTTKTALPLADTHH